MSAQTSSNDASKSLLDDARAAIGELLRGQADLGPQFIRIAFYDAISYDPTTKLDGPNGSIRFWEGSKKEVDKEQDLKMKNAIEKLDQIKARLPRVSYADFYQLAGIEAVKKAGGPTVEFQLGRMDSYIPIQSSKIPTIEDDPSADSLRATFHRIGFTDKEIVALSSAHYYWKNYTQSLKFDTSYYETLLNKQKEVSSNATNTSNATMQLSRSPTITPLQYWKCLLSDSSFHKQVEHFAKDGESFTKEYAGAHKKLSELGFKHFPEHILTEKEYNDVKHGIALAVAMTILFGFVGFFYETMRT